MAAVVYVLCLVTSLLCAILLLRAYRDSGVRLLLWSSLCFIGLALNSALLFADRVLFPDVDLLVPRSLPVLIGLILLLYGLIWEAE